MILPRRVDADSTFSTARRRNDDRGILLDALSDAIGQIDDAGNLFQRCFAGEHAVDGVFR